MRLQRLKLVHWFFVFLVTSNLTIHFFHLDLPSSVVYDEFHFGKYATSYCCTFKNTFDLHPPHGKLLIAAALKVGGYDGRFEFNEIGESYENAVPTYALRIVPAVFGFFLPFFFMLLIWQLGCGFVLAALGALLITFENGFITQSRFALLDSILLTSFLASLCLAFHSIKQHKTESHISPYSIFVSGLFSGLSTGTKLTGGLSFILVIAILMTNLRGNWKTRTSHLIFFVSGFLVLYLGGWFLHFSLLTVPSSADLFFVQTGNFFQDLFTLHAKMFYENAHLMKPHNDASHWWQWPLMIKSVYYWTNGKADIFFTGNPFVWIGSTLLFFPSFIYLIKKNIFKDNLWLGPLGTIISMAPFLFFQRPLFLYHFLLPLICILITNVSASLEWLNANPERNKHMPWLATSMAFLTLGGFFVVFPLTFGIPENSHLLFEIGPFWR